MSDLRPFPLIERDHAVEGLFVKEVRPAPPSSFAAPLLFVHGAWHGWWVWESWLPFFAGCGWPCFALSLRNHPGSYAVPEAEFLRLSVVDYARDVATVARWIGRPVVLVGHSMGGATVQKAAEALEVRALVLLASTSSQQVGAVRTHDLPTDAPYLPPRERMRPFLFHRIADDAFAAFYPRLVPEAGSVLNETGGGRMPIDPGRIGAPVLVVRGEHDGVPVHPALRLAAYYGGDHLTVPDAGHNLMTEEHVALDVAVAIQRWLLERLPDQGPPRPRPAPRRSGRE